MEYDSASDVSDYWVEYDKTFTSKNSMDLSKFEGASFKPERSQSIKILEDSILEIRKENKITEKNAKVKVRRSTKTKIRTALQDIKKKIDFEIKLAKTEDENMKQEIFDKKQNIEYISKFISDSEFIISQNRIKKYRPTKKPEIEASVMIKTKKKLKMLKLQLEGMKDAIKSYRNTTENTNSAINELKKKLELSKINNEAELKECETQGKQRIAQGKAENAALLAEFQKYKVMKMKELEETENNCKSQRQSIESLQNELKKAKFVIGNPTANLRVYDKLQDYLDQFPGAIKPPGTAPKPQINFFSRQAIAFNRSSLKPQLGTKESDKELVPVVSKFNISQKKSFGEDFQAKTSRSIQNFNKSAQFLI